MLCHLLCLYRKCNVTYYVDIGNVIVISYAYIGNVMSLIMLILGM